MEVIINSVNFKTDATLETFVREKVSKLFNQCNKIIRADVILRKTEDGNPKNKLCEIKLMIPGNDHFVKKCSEVYEKSILQAVQVLKKIMRRRKTKVIKKRNFHYVEK
jgi:ribosome-associated translation inhibitor RaiA